MSAKERASRKHYPPELKLSLVKMALAAINEGRSVAAIAREYSVNDNLLFKWMRLWQREGQISRPRGKYRKTVLPVLLPVQVTPPVPVLPTATTSADPQGSVCHVRLRQGDITLHNPSSELLSLVLREMMSGTGGAR
ncbi:transposase [Pectobacterium versatile]|uniref:transposase n=1 Tax=Pectobacterium versatile TaxID=2488639 RepID=UPI001CF142F5|nr:transposase [Pectobacterium versatile]MCA6935389.1 transposase [Pectobacterium versatile]